MNIKCKHFQTDARQNNRVEKVKSKEPSDRVAPLSAVRASQSALNSEESREQFGEDMMYDISLYIMCNGL